MKQNAKIVGLALLCLAFGSQALTLGRIRGAALIGHPLDMTVQVQMDAGESASSLCFDADVFHADARQDASRVRVVVEAATQGLEANVRILSSAAVDEPVVTVYLRTGCGQKTTRRYVLLADLPSEVAAPLVPWVVPATAPPVVAASAKVESPTPQPVVAAPALQPVVPIASTAVPAARRVVKRPVRRATDGQRPQTRTATGPVRNPSPGQAGKPGSAAGQSRLTLDTLELPADRVVRQEPASAPAPSEESLRNLQKMQALEADVKALRGAAARNDASLLELKARLQQAETERFSGTVFYTLLALLLASLAALAFLWNRQRLARSPGDDWWSGTPATSTTPSAQSTRTAAGVTGASMLPVDATGVDSDLPESEELNFADLVPPDAAHDRSAQQEAGAASTEVVGGRLAHHLNSEVLLDIRQQTEFFVARGQADRAMEILRRQIKESDEPNPSIYLDLLGLFHTHNLKVDFRQLRQDFNLLFTGQVPEFFLFGNEGRSLESYPEVMSTITRLWPTSRVLERIESCIFRDPWDDSVQSFDIAAFRDLLVLHAVAQSVAPVRPAVPAARAAAVASDSRARAAGQPGFTSTMPAGFSVVPESSRRSSPEIRRVLALDLDLSVPHVDENVSSQASGTEVDLPLFLDTDHGDAGPGFGDTDLAEASKPSPTDGKEPA